MRTRTKIRRDHRGSHLAETLYVRTPSGVVLLAGVHAAQRVQREAEISDALFRRTQHDGAIQRTTELLRRNITDHARSYAEHTLARLEALPPVHVPEPLPAVTIFAPPLVRDKRTARSAQDVGVLS